MRAFGFGIVIVLLSGCSQSEDGTLALQVTAQDHTFTLNARGAIFSSQSIPINAPMDMTMQMNIDWLLPEFTNVKAGDLVATLEESILTSVSRDAQLQIAAQTFAMRNHIVDSGVNRSEIEHESSRVDGETVIAETFANFDPRYLSRIEIIDAVGDLDYLGAEALFYDWQYATHEERTQAGLSMFETARMSAEQRLEKNERALAATEIRSPVDGVFIHARTMWGQKVSRGRAIFPGRAIGMLPVEGQIEARLFIPKSDAIGLAVGQAVDIRIDTNVTHVLKGEIERVSPMATTRNRDDPRQYVVVTAKLSEDDAEGVRVGSSLTATLELETLENAIVLPNQSVFTEGEETFVYIQEGTDLNRRSVDVGFRSASLVELVAGVEDGEMVSLVAPKVSEG